MSGGDGEVVVEKCFLDGGPVQYLPKETMLNDDSSQTSTTEGAGGGQKGFVERLVVRNKIGGTVKAVRMPFRSHQLTTYLKDCFTNRAHRTVVLAAVSPLGKSVRGSPRGRSM